MRLGLVRFVARRGAREPVETFGKIDHPRAQPRCRGASVKIRLAPMPREGASLRRAAGKRRGCGESLAVGPQSGENRRIVIGVERVGDVSGEVLVAINLHPQWPEPGAGGWPAPGMSGLPGSPNIRARAPILSVIDLKASRSDAAESRLDLASASRIPCQRKNFRQWAHRPGVEPYRVVLVKRQRHARTQEFAEFFG